MEFKVGDRVKVNREYNYSGWWPSVKNLGDIVILRKKQTSSNGIAYWNVDGLDEGWGNYVLEENIQLINNKTMNIKESFILALTKEPQKSFRKAGITNGDDMLTDDGVKIFLTWLLNKQADLFKSEVVDGLLADMKEEK